MLILDGKKVSEHLKNQLKTRVEDFKKQYGTPPLLKVIIVGQDKASQVYVKNKHLACEKVGMKSEILELPASLTEEQLIQEIDKLNKDPRVDGILVQLPVPKTISTEAIFKSINSEKDADGITFFSTGLLWSGVDHVFPCTPSGVIKILKYYNIPIKGQRATVIGRSQIVGKPMAAMLLNENATVTIAHSGTADLQEITKGSDIVVVAAGKPNFFGAEYFSEKSVVVDVGIHGTGSGKLCGDVNFAEVNGKVSAITPVPGGVGPMTIACLLENTLDLALKRKRQS